MDGQVCRLQWSVDRAEAGLRLSVDQRTYICEHLQGVSIEHVDRSDGDRKLRDWDVSLMRGLLGKLMWVAQVSRPVPAAPASLLSARMPETQQSPVVPSPLRARGRVDDAER